MASAIQLPRRFSTASDVQQAVTNLTERSKITIAFARTRGGMDIQLPINTSVADTKPDDQRPHSPKAILDFYACSKELLESMTAAASEPTANAAPGKHR